MPISPARAAAFDILLRVERQDAYAAELLHSDTYARLSSRDHGLATELVMGALRWQSWLDGRIAEQSSQSLAKLDPEILIALRLGAYQLAFLQRVPGRAAVNESVALAKRARKSSAAGYVNAVLRKLAAEGISQDAAKSIDGAATPAELAKCSAHPLWMVERWERAFGLEIARSICSADQQIPEIAIRLAAPELADELKAEGIELGPGKLLTGARRLLSGDLAKTRAFREGRVAIQDEASQLVALLVGRGAKILDCCAAPGGKTRILAQRNPEAEIVAVELHPHRARLLHKLVRQSNVRIVTGDVREVLARESEQFACALADVPCSGTGTLAHNPEIKWRLRPEDLENFRERQVAILRAAMRKVAAGGRLVYSTCSLEKEENEDVVQKALADDESFEALDCRKELEQLRDEGELAWADAGSLTTGQYLRTVPGLHPCEGFFAAILRKRE